MATPETHVSASRIAINLLLQPTALLLAAGPLAVVVFTPFVIAAGRATAGYGHISSTFSDASAQGSPHPELISTGLLLVALCLLLFSFGIARVLPANGRLTRWGLWVVAFGMVGTALFQDHNRSGPPGRNLEGYVHNAFAIVCVIGTLAAIAVSTAGVRSDPAWNQLIKAGIFAWIVAAIAAVAFNFGPDSWDGLAERVLMGSALAWVTILAWTGVALLSRDGQWSVRGATHAGIDATAPVSAED